MFREIPAACNSQQTTIYIINNEEDKNTSLKNSLKKVSSISFDEFPEKVIGKIISYLPLEDVLRLAKITPVFWKKAVNVITKLDDEGKFNIVFSRSYENGPHALKNIIGMGQDVVRIAKCDHNPEHDLLETAICYKVDNALNLFLEIDRSNNDARVNFSVADYARAFDTAVFDKNGYAVDTLLNISGFKMNTVIGKQGIPLLRCAVFSGLHIVKKIVHSGQYDIK